MASSNKTSNTFNIQVGDSERKQAVCHCNVYLLLTSVLTSGNHCCGCCGIQGLMHVNGRPVAAFDPEGLIFAAGVDSEMVKLYDLRSFDKVCSIAL